MQKIFSIDKDYLQTILNSLTTVTQKKAIDPLSNSIIITSVNSKIKFQGTNMEQFIDFSTSIEVLYDFRFIVDSKTFANIVKVLENTIIDIYQKNNQIVILDSNASFSLDLLQVELPARPVHTMNKIFSIESHILSKLIEGANLPLGEEGIFSIEGKGNSLFFIAKDRRRISFNFCEATTNSFIINLKEKVKNEILNFKAKEILIVGDHGDEIFFQQREKILFSKKITGTFFDINKYFDTTDFTVINLNKKIVLKILKKLKVMVSPLTKCLDLNLENNQLTFKVFSPSSGNATESITIEGNVPPLQIKLNIEYFIQSINLSDENITLFIKNNHTQIIINNKHLIMPIRF